VDSYRDLRQILGHSYFPSAHVVTMQYNAKVSSQDEEPNMYVGVGVGVGGQLLWEGVGETFYFWRAMLFCLISVGYHLELYIHVHDYNERIFLLPK
jgi:hypothetical protein